MPRFRFHFTANPAPVPVIATGGLRARPGIALLLLLAAWSVAPASRAAPPDHAPAHGYRGDTPARPAHKAGHHAETPAFRAAYPFVIRPIGRFAAALHHGLRQRLPAYVRFGGYHDRADLVLRARLVDSNVAVRVVDRDYKYKKVKGRHASRTCPKGAPIAFLRVKKEARAHATYAVRLFTPGHGFSTRHVSGHARERWKEAARVDLPAGCAGHGDHVPNKRLNTLAHRGDRPDLPPHRQKGLTHAAREDAMEQLVHMIHARMRHHYQALAQTHDPYGAY
ncbi:hypothetical protein [Yunchengibacter salinarum]|uniref:hypothetical protein n=1 Tax=Yunchengibacter salinarum TaxID=3133399 RepID=UPI0035B5A7D9